MVYRSSDFITSEADSRAIVENVKALHPGRGELRIIEQMGHYFTVAADQASSFKIPDVGIIRRINIQPTRQQ